MAESKKCANPVLPVDGKRNVLITSALPYVNNVPHLGNIIGSVLSADVYARFSRARGHPTLYVCGTDEYGTTTETRALVEKVTPKELCDKYHAIHAGIYEWFNLSFDIFGRTTTEAQTEITQEIFLKLHEKGFLEERNTTQLYCEEHKSFLADRFVEGECPKCAYPDARGDQCDGCGSLLDPFELKKPRCKVEGATPVPRDTNHIFFKLDTLQPEIESWFQESAEKGGWSPNAKQITAAWLKQGLEGRSITRDMKWGTAVPLPGYEEKVIYPWFDACIGYVSITACYTDEWQKWWHNPDNVELYQFLGKDNVVFHAVIFPGTEIGTRDVWTKPHNIAATEYLTYEGGKFSKSRGIGVFGDSARKTGVAADVWRFYLLSHRPESSDTEFNWDVFISDNNNLLLKNLGNFVSRVVKFVNSKNYNNVVPDYTKYQDESIDAFKKRVNELLGQYVQELDAAKIKGPLNTILEISAEANAFLQSNKLDNKLAETEPERCAAVVGLALNLIHLLSALLGPYMPDTAASINQQLKAEAILIPDTWSADTIKPGHEIGKAAYLFTNIKPEKGEEWREMFGSEEVRKAKEEAAAKKAKKKAAMKKKPKGEGKEAKEAKEAKEVAEVAGHEVVKEHREGGKPDEGKETIYVVRPGPPAAEAEAEAPKEEAKTAA
ncbi:probable Methionyl-tRNA synthetase [Cephalotrichum gorgonifer]|uniref:methionine--tRNA ligase n=1 Tax=Cephalotrichum gorgonifer TaxID=2041049 RepID=A0AAE8SV33_9PEZI|nr:probable Methionyl-tRNA synthetase [Cephalotrichum gorgonifer]